MAVEPVGHEAHAHEVEAHVRDYSRFLKMLKYGAIASFITGMVVVVIIAN
jgi:hypothetical protein